ncbi:LPS-assembly protein LptD [Labeo rohita]|uniref:LPS-assembly protein LptD n=1 Tax=Labeo rohita TaxID=84645 RepID=A0ABQ8M260_LABRO|nr:LPS-assembly protein LptD [Labeo rohita]
MALTHEIILVHSRCAKTFEHIHYIYIFNVYIQFIVFYATNCIKNALINHWRSAILKCYNFQNMYRHNLFSVVFYGGVSFWAIKLL